MDLSERKPVATWPWLALLVPALAVATAALLGALGVVFNATGTTLAVSDQERALLIDIEGLSSVSSRPGPIPGAVSAPRVTKTRFVDGSIVLAYVYDDPSTPSAPYLSYSVTVEPDPATARNTYVSQWGGTHVGLWSNGARFELDEPVAAFRWGDASRFAILVMDGAPFGSVFAARKGRLVVYCIVSGVVLTQASELESLLGPSLERLSEVDPADAFD